jgi:hypothetical protein
MAVFVNRVANNVGTTEALLHSDDADKCILIGLNLSNKTGSTVPVHVFLRKSSQDYHVIVGRRVPPGESLEVMQGNKMVIEVGDALYIKSDINNSLDVVASLLHGVE